LRASRQSSEEDQYKKDGSMSHRQFPQNAFGAQDVHP
jgi:hypothetical protein